MNKFKMRVVEDKNCKCQFCNEEWKNVEEMFDLKIEDNIYRMCRGCMQDLFQKLLTADCKYIGKLKSKEDIARSERWHSRKNKALKEFLKSGEKK